MRLEVLAGDPHLVLQFPRTLQLLVLSALLLVPLLRARGRGAGGLVGLLLRAGALVLVVLSLAGLAVERTESTDRLCVVVAADLSESVGADGARTAASLVRAIRSELLPEDRLGAVAFGREARVIQWPAPAAIAPVFDAATVDGSGTRLAAGIEAALPLCPEDTERKVVLVTDGNETLGDSRRAANLARELGVQLFAVVPAVGGDEAKISFEKLVVPPVVREGSVFPVRVIVRSSLASPSAGELDLRIDGVARVHESVRFDPGLNVFEVPLELAERGSVRLGAAVSATGGSGGMGRDASLTVSGPIRALIVTEVEDPPLARALRLKNVDVETVLPKELPPLEQLLQYHCVILDDVPRRALDGDALAALESYVRDFGGGFVFAGGPRSFGDKGYRQSAVERALPVSLVPQKPKSPERAAMGVFLLVDRSNSMLYNSRRRDTRDGEKMRYAKQAARALISQLRDQDYVGVVAFDSDPYVLGGLRPLSEDREELLDRIERLLPGGGTDFKEALEIAGSQLTASGLKVRHVILLTDGDTNRGAGDHFPLIEALAKLGISVTTIRIGDDDVNLELLKQISQQTGGRFYHVEDLSQLPQLLIRDTQQAGGEEREKTAEAAAPPPSAVPEGGVRPRIGSGGPIARGFDGAEFPPVEDIVETRPKPDADVVLWLPRGEDRVPLLASWQYGLGRVAAFSLDPASGASAQWVGWAGFAKLWSQLVRWAIREETPWDTRQTVRAEGDGLVLEVQTFDDSDQSDLVAEVFTGPGQSFELALTPVAPRLFRAALPPLPSGRYPMNLSQRSGEKVVARKNDVLAIEETVAGDGGNAAEFARRRPDRELLRELTDETGGTVDPAVAQVAARRGRTRPVQERIDWLLIPCAIALVIGDVAIRRRNPAA